MSLIISTRYFSPLQWILKVLCTILGATSLIEAIGRVTTKAGIMARVRPQTYYRPSERTYSRLFSEIQAAVDTTLVKLQRIVLAEDLQGTFIAFASTIAGYWLIQAIPPFWLAIGTTLLVYTLAPILTGPHSAQLKDKTQELSSRALDTASSASNNAAAKARDLKDQAINTASSTGIHAAHKTQDLSSRAVNTASSAGTQAANKTQELGSRAMDTASSAGAQTANKTQEQGSRAMDTASYASNNAAAKAHHVQDQTYDLAANATNRTANNARNATGTQGVAFNSRVVPAYAQGYDDNDLSRERHVRVQPVTAETQYRAI